MDNASSTLPAGVTEFLERLSIAAGTNSINAIDAALHPLSTATTDRVQRALQPLCGHAMDHRAMEILSEAFAQIAREAQQPAVAARMRELLGTLLSRECGK